MNASLLSKILFAVFLLASSYVHAQSMEMDLSSPPAEIIALQDKVELLEDEGGIEIADYAAPQSGTIGLWTANELNLPDDLWQNISEADALKLVAALPADIQSEAVKTIILRVLTVEPARSDFTGAMLMGRVNALLKMGQAELARQLLAAVPDSLVSDDILKQKFLLEVAKSSSRDELCKQASDKQTSEPGAFWQRFKVLCLTVNGENDKAQLGLALLREQNNASELFAEIVSAIGNDKSELVRKEYEREALIWSLFANSPEQEEGMSKEQQALLTLNKSSQNGLNLQAIKIPSDSSPNISLSLMRVEPKATATEVRRALLAAAFRRVWDKPIPVETEDALLSQSYRTELTELSPIWSEAISLMLENNQRLASLLIMVRPLTAPLSHYTVGDLSYITSELNALGLANDATALADEALKSD